MVVKNWYAYQQSGAPYPISHIERNWLRIGKLINNQGHHIQYLTNYCGLLWAGGVFVTYWEEDQDGRWEWKPKEPNIALRSLKIETNISKDGWAWAQANLVEGRFQIKSASLGLLTGVKEAKGIFYSGFYIDQPRENCALAYYESSISIHEIQHYSWPKWLFSTQTCR